MKNLILIIFICIGIHGIMAQETPDLIFQVGHSAYVNSIAVSYDGKLFASGDFRKEIKLWDIRCGKLISTFRGQKDYISDIQFSPDQEHIIASGSYPSYSHIDYMIAPEIKKPYELLFFDIKTGEISRSIKANMFGITNFEISGKGQNIICGGYDNKINTYDYTTGKLVRSVNTGIHLRTIKVSPDEKFIAAGGYDDDKYAAVVKIFDLISGKEINKIKWGKGLQVNSISFFPKSDKIVAGCGLAPVTNKKQASAFIIDLNSGKITSEFTTTCKSVNSVIVMPDEKHFWSCGKEPGELKEWNIPDKSLSHSFDVNSDVFDMAILPGNKYLICGGGAVAMQKGLKSELVIWGIPDKKRIRDFTNRIMTIGSSTASKDGKFIYVSGSDRRIRKFNMVSGKLENISRPLLEDIDIHGDLSIDINKDEQYLLASVNALESFEKIYSEVILFNAKDLREIRKIPNSLAAFFTPDGNQYITMDFTYKSLFKNYSTINLCDVITGNNISSYDKISGYSIFNPSDKKCDLFITTTAETSLKGLSSYLHVWDFNKKKPVYELVSATTNQDMGEMIGIPAISNDCQKLAVPMYSFLNYAGRLLEIDLNSGKTIHQISIPAGNSGMASYSSDDKYIYQTTFTLGESVRTNIYNTSSWKLDGTVNGYMYDFINQSGDYIIAPSGLDQHSVSVLKKGINEPGVSLVFVPDGDDYILYTPSRYYMSSRNGYNAIAYKINDKVFSYEQFDLKYNRPDLVLEKLPGSSPIMQKLYHKAYLKRLEKMDFTEEMLGDDFSLPEIEITNANDIGLENKESSVILTVAAKDSKYPLDRINVYVNNIPVYGFKGIRLRDKNISQHKQQIKLELSRGMNKIEVSALNINGAESYKEAVYTSYSGNAVKPDLYVIAIGISEYKSPENNLSYAKKDASDIAELFELRKEAYNKVNIIRIFNQDATKENIMKVKDILSESHVDDKVILFYAGHGLLDESLDYYLSTYDIDFLNPSSQGLAYNDFENLLNGIPARKKLILIDACHSGELDKQEIVFVEEQFKQEGQVNYRGFKDTQRTTSYGINNIFELMKELFVDLRRGTGAHVISSSAGGEFSFESEEWENGVFTYSLIHGLKTGMADGDENSEVSVSELREFVFNEVVSLTKGQQNPTSRRENIEFDFEVW